MTKQLFKRYAVSTAVTFFAGFALVMYGEIDTLTMESFKDGTLVGTLFVATRTGVKMLLELFLNKVANR